MGREFPLGDHQNAVEIHPYIITMSLFIASVAATIAVVSSLCGALSRKKTPPSSVAAQNHEAKDENIIQVPSPTLSTDHSPAKDSSSLNHHHRPAAEINAPQSDQESPPQPQPLPLPPGKQSHLTGAASYHSRSNSTASTSSVSSQLRKLPASMSMRALGNGIGIGLSSSRQSSKREQQELNNVNYNDHHQKKKNREKKLKHEDSIWKKTIILGEKCKVPDENDEDAILYDEKGNRIPTYHRKTTSMALSRQNSGVDMRDATSVVDPEILRNALAGRN